MSHEDDARHLVRVAHRVAGHEEATPGGADQDVRRLDLGRLEEGLQVAEQVVHLAAAGWVAASTDAGAVV